MSTEHVASDDVEARRIGESLFATFPYFAWIIPKNQSGGRFKSLAFDKIRGDGETANPGVLAVELVVRPD